jgi:tetratricopeptide (TPR) repeat protein
MKRNKILFYLVLAGTLISSSCSKFLTVEPQEAISDEITIVDENSAKTAVRGIYNQLESNGYYGYTFQTLGFFSGDNIEYAGSQIVNKQLTNHDVKADLAALSTAWAAIYNTINRANHVIAKVPALPATATFTDAVKNGLVGEAYFVRALAYFDLARTWGGVQLVLTPTTSASDKPKSKKASLQQTYAQVLADLTTAESLLTATTTNRIRATRKTVWALRARLHLYLQQWDQAEAYATKIIDDNANYKLIAPYNAFFANGATSTQESVFELYYTTTVTNNQASQWLPGTKGGVGWIKPTSSLVTLLNNPLKGGNRNTVIQADAGSWFGALYYRVSGSGGTDPAYLIRLAELYLIRAEARVQQDTPDKLAKGKEDLDAVRARAGLTGSTATLKGDLLLAIEEENRLEFALENHRWYDLVRTGRAQTVLGILDARKLLLPIPYGEVLVGYPELEQNPSYVE